MIPTKFRIQDAVRIHWQVIPPSYTAPLYGVVEEDLGRGLYKVRLLNGSTLLQNPIKSFLVFGKHMSHWILKLQ